MAVLKVDLSEVDCHMIAQAIEVKQAQIKRAFNAASDSVIKDAYRRQALEFADLSRKFPVKG